MKLEDVALQIAQNISEGWGIREEERVAAQIVPFLATLRRETLEEAPEKVEALWRAAANRNTASFDGHDHGMWRGAVHGLREATQAIRALVDEEGER